MLTFSDQNFDQKALQSVQPVLVDFFAEWCGPCKMLGPIVETLAKEYEGKIKIAKLDVDKSPQTAQKYNVMGVPTIIIFKKGKEVKRHIGLASKQQLKEIIDGLL